MPNKVEPLWQWPGKKKSLKLEEWWFEGCPRDELQHCLAYEYGRHIHKVVWDYHQDKKQKFKYGGSDIRENGIWNKYINLYDGHEQEIPLDVYVIDAPSGFPEKPFLKVDRSRLDKEKFQLSTPVRIFPYDSTKRLKANFAVQINWAYSNKRIIAGVKKWLEKRDRPKPTKVQGLAPDRTLRAELKVLGAYRLIKFCGSVEAAMKLVKNQYGKGLPYANPNKWHVAKRKVQKKISDINLQSGFWHPDIELLANNYFQTTPYWDAYGKAIKKGN